MGPEQRLAVYGSLAPGKSNHHQLDELSGDWAAGALRGRLFQDGFGTGGRYPGLELDPGGGEVTVQVFTSPDLPAHWARLDRFEGADYARVVVEVMTEQGPVAAQVYMAARPRA
jgi:gamma-glutamylcyclotransferase (GGCT)/AIG2-like uncharacterized protein YtfP